MNTINQTREIALYSQNPPEASQQEKRPSQYVKATEVARGPFEDQVSIDSEAEEQARTYAHARVVSRWLGPEYVLRYTRRGEGILVDPRTEGRENPVDFFI